MATPAEQERAVRPLVRREVLRQVLAPTRVIGPRLVLYYLPPYKEIDRPWVSVRNALSSLEEDGDLVTERPAGNAKWYRLPHVKPDKLDTARATKPPLFAEWTQALQRAGHHAEELWRQAFRAAGWTVPNGPIRIDCPLPDDEEGAHSEEHEIDVFATRPGLPWQVACEVKNGYGEGWVDPSIVAEWKLTDPQRRIRHHFRLGHTRADSDPPSNYRQFAERLPRILQDQSNRAAS